MCIHSCGLSAPQKSCKCSRSGSHETLGDVPSLQSIMHSVTKGEALLSVQEAPPHPPQGAGPPFPAEVAVG